VPDNNPCDGCNAKCCRYIALEIDTPEDRNAQENIRWYLSHTGVQVYVEDGKWHLQVNTKCRHLDKNNRCGNYADRPKICRSYKTGNCENSNTEYDYELHFKSDAEYKSYLAKQKKKKKQSGKASRK